MRNNIVSIRILEHIKNTGCSLTTEIFNFNRTKEFISINAAYLSGIMIKKYIHSTKNVIHRRISDSDFLQLPCQKIIIE
ncbi:Uncharacterised protein [Klebsiella pneumoniae]|nr:Uncharacterised protein [Klebsiella pneumoniae]